MTIFKDIFDFNNDLSIQIFYSQLTILNIIYMFFHITLQRNI